MDIDTKQLIADAEAYRNRRQKNAAAEKLRRARNKAKLLKLQETVIRLHEELKKYKGGSNE